VREVVPSLRHSTRIRLDGEVVWGIGQQEESRKEGLESSIQRLWVWAIGFQVAVRNNERSRRSINMLTSDFKPNPEK